MLLQCAVVDDTVDKENVPRRYSASGILMRRLINEKSPSRKLSGESITSIKSSNSRSSRVTFRCDVKGGSDGESDCRSTESVCSGSSSKERGSISKRFKRMISRSLRRTKSAGCAKDVPAHAMFLAESQFRQRHNTMESRSVHFTLLSQRIHDSVADENKRDIRKAYKSLSADVALVTASETMTETSQPKSKSKKSSSFQNVKRKFHFLRRRHTDTSLVPNFSLPRHIPSYPQVLQWSKSFESLLSDKTGLQMFKDFLTSEFSEENLEFWIACEELRFASQATIPALAHKIYADFVAFKAPKEINLDSATRLTTVTNLESPSKDTFLVAQHKIQALMEKDSYPRFIQSQMYQQLVERLSKS